MADLIPYALTYSFTDFQASSPADPLPAPQLDEQFFDISASIGSLVSGLGDIRRSDGALKNGIVTAESLDPTLLSGVPTPTLWVTATAYDIGETVYNGPKLYVARTAHTSGVFATDLAVGRWALVADFTPPGTLSAAAVTYTPIAPLVSTNVQAAVDEVYASIAIQVAAATSGGSLGDLAALDFVDTAHINAGAVTLSKMAANSVGTSQMVSASVTADKLSGTVGQILVGTITPWAGPELPARYLWARGQAADRVTYAALYEALTCVATATRANGSPTLSTVSKDVSALGLVGSKIEGTGIPSGTTIMAATSTTITLSANATSSGSAGAIRVFPHGNGDGVSTFNVVDCRGYALVGRDNMGAASANRLTNQSGGIDGDVFAATGGEETHTNTIAEMPLHGHPFRLTLSNVNSSTTGGLLVSANDTRSNQTANSGALGDAAGNQIGGTGGGGAHNNIQPSKIINYIIFVGV